jgi:hypothetical protein
MRKMGDSGELEKIWFGSASAILSVWLGDSESAICENDRKYL